MKKNLVRWLSALLAAMLLLGGAALMEELPAEDVPAAEETPVIEEVPAAEEPIEETVEEPVEDAVAEPVEAEVEATEAALVDEVEEDEPEIAEIEAPVIEETEPVYAAQQPAAEAEESVIVAQTEDASAKLMEGEGNIPIDEAHFPDAAFRAYLIEKFGQGFPEGTVPVFRPDTVDRLDLYKDLQSIYGDGAYEGLGITSLQGIEYFPNLVTLCSIKNSIGGLDVSAFKNLESLLCQQSNITSLNVSGCTNLKFINVAHNALTTLDLSGLPHFAGFPAGFKRSTEFLKKQGHMYYYDGKGEILLCDPTVTIICNGVAINAKTGKKTSAASAAPAVAAAFIEVPGAVPATVTVDPSSTAKNTKASVIAAPGSAMQLDLSGAAAKKFKSSKKKVATVDKLGIVYFKKGGKVKITYKVGKQTRKVTLTVYDPTMPTAIALDQAGTVAAKKGDTVALTATLNEGAVSGVKWKSSNKKVATVSNGVVTFKKAGKVTITAITTRGKKKAKVKFVVSK